MHTVFALLCFVVVIHLLIFPISIRLTSLALWKSNDCPSASKATLMNMDKYFMWIHYERLHNHNKAKHNKTVCIFLGIYCNHIPHKQLLKFVHRWFITSAVLRYCNYLSMASFRCWFTSSLLAKTLQTTSCNRLMASGNSVWYSVVVW